MSKKKTTPAKKYILIHNDFNEVVLIGNLQEITEEIADKIQESEDAEVYKVYELGNELSVYAEAIGWDINIF